MWRISKYLVALISLLTMLTLLAGPAYSANDAKLYVDPLRIVDYSYTPGITFTVNVSLDDVVDLHTCQFNITYNSGVIGCFGMVVGPSENEPIDTDFGWDDVSGKIWFNVTYRIPVTSENPVTLSTIYFFVKARGESPIDIYGSSLRNSLGNPISCEVSDGYFSNFNPYDINSDGVVDMLDI